MKIIIGRNSLLRGAKLEHVIVNSVKITFFNFPYEVEHPINFEGIIQIPALIDLAAMKTYALGGRAKWKDYVDLYFILKDYHDFRKISSKATEIFGNSFNSKLFREQLCYFDDIDYSEKIEYVGEQVEDEKIKIFLTDIATKRFE